VSPPAIGVCVEVWARLIIGRMKKVKRKAKPGRRSR
jgi:hypothetical protein